MNKEIEYKNVKVTLRNTMQYVRILNGMFQLTNKETVILSAFLDKAKQLEGTGISPFSTEAKKQVAEELGIEDFNTLNIYIMRLKEKNALRRINEEYKFNPILVKKEGEKGIKFTWQEKKN